MRLIFIAFILFCILMELEDIGDTLEKMVPAKVSVPAIQEAP